MATHKNAVRAESGRLIGRLPNGTLITASRWINWYVLRVLKIAHGRVIASRVSRRTRVLMVDALNEARASGMRPSDFDVNAVMRKSLMQALGELKLQVVAHRDKA